MSAHPQSGRPRSLEAGPGKAELRPYTPPRLEALGDIRDLTLGGSPGIGDSGSGATTQIFPS